MEFTCDEKTTVSIRGNTRLIYCGFFVCGYLGMIAPCMWEDSVANDTHAVLPDYYGKPLELCDIKRTASN